MSDSLEITILGSGSSTGVPRVGGPGGAGFWGDCDPSNPKNRRRRCSALIRRRSNAGETIVLVDTAPDLREQLLDAHVEHVDAALITHAHADQTHGIDDLLALTFATGKRIEMFSDVETMEIMTSRFSYCFATPKGTGYTPILAPNVIAEPFVPFTVEGVGGPVPVTSFWQQHGPIQSLGFRFGAIAYSSDVNGLDDAAFAALEGVELWIVDALRYRPHPTHANLETALAWIARVKPKHAVLTNLHLDLDYETLRRELPAGIEPAYDGMRLSVSL